MSKKVLFISYDGMTDPLGQSQVLPYLAALSAEGYSITILSFEKKERYQSERKIIEGIAQKAGIQWVPLFFTSRPPLLSKMYDRWQMMRTAKGLHKKERFDIIHCRSYIAAEAGLKLKRKFGTKFLFDMRGFWANEKVDNGQWNQQRYFFRKLFEYYKKKEKAFLTDADGIVCLTQNGKDYLLSVPGYENLQIDVIPCCADLAHFDYHRVTEQQSAQLKKELSISSDKKIITYLGSIGSWYMTDEMFSFYRRLILKYPEFIMLILTKDNEEQVMREAAAAGIEPQQLKVKYAKRDEVPAYLSISDCSIFFIRPTFSKKASSPTKHAELMGMGVPTICNDIGDTGNIIRATGAGVVVDSFSGEAYDKVVNQLPVILDLPRELIRNAGFEYFDLKKGAAKYLGLYQRLLQE